MSSGNRERGRRVMKGPPLPAPPSLVEAPYRGVSPFSYSLEQFGTRLGPVPVLMQLCRLRLSSGVSWELLRNPTLSVMTDTEVPPFPPAWDDGQDFRKLQRGEGRSGAASRQQGTGSPSGFRPCEQAFTPPGLFPTHKTRKLEHFYAATSFPLPKAALEGTPSFCSSLGGRLGHT